MQKSKRKKALESNDVEKIKSATEKLTQVSYEVFGKFINNRPKPVHHLNKGRQVLITHKEMRML